MWYDTEDWTKISFFKKCFNIVLIHFVFFLWIIVGIRVSRDYRVLSAPRLAESFSVGLGGFLVYLSFLRYASHRHQLTKVIREVDAKFLAVPKSTQREKEWWKKATKNYLTEGYIFFGGMFVGSLPGVSQFLAMLLSGTLFYDTVVFISDESYSWPWWLQCFYQGWNIAFAGFFYSIKDFILMDLFYHLAVLNQVQADKVMQLCEGENYDEEEEYRLLAGALKEAVDLNR